jgi:hypothetical protein
LLLSPVQTKSAKPLSDSDRNSEPRESKEKIA